MAVSIPKLSELYSDILGDLESQLSINIPLFGKIFLRGLAGVQAAKLKLYYLALSKVQKNLFIDTAEPESIGGTLERFGRVKLNRDPFPAQPAQYNVTVTGTIGALIKAQTTFKSNDDSLNSGALYVLNSAHTMVTVSDTINLRAMVSGLDSQLIVADNLTATAPIANIDSIVIVSSETVAPLSSETIEEYREKGIEAYRLEPQGGAATDYRLWSSNAQGVAESYPYALTAQQNEVIVYVEATIADSTDSKGTPSATILTDVAAVIELDPDTTKPLNERGRRPLGVFLVTVSAITPLDVTIQIVNYQELTSDKQTLILNALTTAISKIRPFVAGADIEANRNEVLSVFNISYIIQQAIPNSRFDSITLTVGGSAVSNKTFLNGDIPYLASISYA